MREYVIVTDSCCDFSQDLIRDLDLTVIPLSVQLGGQVPKLPGRGPREPCLLYPSEQGRTGADFCAQCGGVQGLLFALSAAGKGRLVPGFFLWTERDLSQWRHGGGGTAGGISRGQGHHGGYPVCLNGTGPFGGLGGAGEAKGEGH